MMALSQQLMKNFTEEISQVLNSIGNKKEIALIGDFNCRIDRKTKNEVIGHFGEDTVNDNGSRLLEIC